MDLGESDASEPEASPRQGLERCCSLGKEMGAQRVHATDGNCLSKLISILDLLKAYLVQIYE